MLLAEAKSYIGKTCSIAWQDRTGKEFITVSKVYDATYVPLYGGYLVTDVDDIRLDRVCGIALMEEAAARAAVTPEKVTA
jgi:hypothetical protein